MTAQLKSACEAGHTVAHDGCLHCLELAIAHDVAAREAQRARPPVPPEQAHAEKVLADYTIRAAAAAVHLSEKAASLAASTLGDRPAPTSIDTAKDLVDIAQSAAKLTEQLDRVSAKILAR